MAAPASTIRSIVYLVAAMSLFAMVDGFSKMLVADQSFGQIMLARYVLTLPALLLITRPKRWVQLFHTAHPILQLVRGFSPVMVGGSMVLALKFLPLAEATVILFAGPFLVVALSGPLLGERVRLTSWIAVAMGFLAVLLVARPGLGGLSVYALFPLLAALFYAVLQLLSRQLADLGESPMATLAWTLATGLVVSIPLAMVQWQPVASGAWPLFLGLGITFGLAQFCLVQAYRMGTANVLASLTYSQIVAAVAFGYVAFGDVPDGWALAGIALIIAAGVLMVMDRRA